MPIEIKELVIKTTIEEVQKQQQEESSEPAPSIDEKQLVKDCVDKVLDILEKKGQR